MKGQTLGGLIMNKEILNILPITIRQVISKLNETMTKDMEELRIRERRPLEIIFNNQQVYISQQGKITRNENEAYYPTKEDTYKMLNLISNHSIYRLEEELKRGYITIHGGHRIGIAGKAVIENGTVKSLKDISSFNIRIAKQKIGIAKPIIPFLIADGNGIQNTLIISPPQCGKTTLLRDIARSLSAGNSNLGQPGKKVGIIDERSEIAGCVEGVPQNDVGPRTDILDACPKAEGMMMMIRSMSPDVLIVDEIGRQEDTTAIIEARNAGVSVVATAHGMNMQEIMKRPTISALIQQEIFTRFIILSRKKGVGTIEAILDGNLRQLYLREKSYA